MVMLSHPLVDGNVLKMAACPEVREHMLVK